MANSKNPDSPRKQFLMSLVHPESFPKCPFGKAHIPNICMGCKESEKLGHQYYWCDRCGQNWGRELSEAERTELHKKLDSWDREVRAKGQDAHRAGKLSASSSAPSKETHVNEASNSLALVSATMMKDPISQSASVDIYISLAIGDNVSRHAGPLVNGFYIPAKDGTFCNLTGFPGVLWEIYDHIQRTFLPILSLSAYPVKDREFLIVHPHGFSDSDCIGLKELKRCFHNLSTSAPLLRKCKRDNEAIMHAIGPSTAQKLRRSWEIAEVDDGKTLVSQKVDRAVQTGHKGKAKVIEIIDPEIIDLTIDDD
ncbi:hypothetical protein CPB84DRAFT_1846369 [Gymnopilus junonius]|uniref:Uncharacterized protein n=1 Tax=Gymnopilus junonius TaxID=109634 RepID=A0A9P5NRE4_GYMJU|nr:hypothetical protein CPB84DRAFT_1846369 [Gymnopilus junonius]